jgi:hypothetical protein
MTATDPIEQIRSAYLARYGTPVTQQGRISGAAPVPGRGALRVQLDIWIENSRHERSTGGAATVEFDEAAPQRQHR